VSICVICGDSAPAARRDSRALPSEGLRIVVKEVTEQEFDMLGSTNGANQRIFLVEIKSHLTEAELRKFERKLGEFFTFFPEHRGKALYGLIAAVDVARGLTERAAQRGIYLALAHDGTFALASPAHFKPRSFS
jgi:hypothetical protein